MLTKFKAKCGVVRSVSCLFCGIIINIFASLTTLYVAGNPHGHLTRTLFSAEFLVILVFPQSECNSFTEKITRTSMAQMTDPQLIGFGHVT